MPIPPNSFPADPPGIGHGCVTVDPAPSPQPPALTEQEINKEVTLFTDLHRHTCTRTHSRAVVM